MPDAPLEKVVVLAATSGIAQAAVRLLAARRAELFLVGRDAARLAAVADDARVRGAARVEVLQADLDDLAGHAAIAARAVAALGRLDAVLLAQGVLPDQRACQADAGALERALRTNLVAPAALLEAFAARLAAQGSGTLVALSSVAGERGRQSNYVYSSAKAGLTTYLAGLRNRLHRAGVHVVTVKPGFVDTAMTAHLPRNALFASPDAVARGVLRAVARRRDVVYLPRFWAMIMLVIRAIPERVFKRLSL